MNNEIDRNTCILRHHKPIITSNVKWASGINEQKHTKCLFVLKPSKVTKCYINISVIVLEYIEDCICLVKHLLGCWVIVKDCLVVSIMQSTIFTECLV